MSLLFVLPEKSSFSLVLINIIMMLVLYFLSKPALRRTLSKDRNIFLCFMIFSFCMFSFWGGDWFGYYHEYEFYKINTDLNSHMEAIYLDLIRKYTSSYIQFRFFIWGSVLLLIFFYIKRLKLPLSLAIFCFVSASLIWVSYSRVSLAMALMFLGASYLPIDNSQKKNFLIAVPLIFLSYFFHKSAVFGIGAIMLGYISLTKKNILKICIWAYPVMLILVVSLLSTYMSLDIDNEDLETSISAGQRYLEGESSTGILGGGVAPKINKLLEWTPRYMLAYICYKTNNRGQIIRKDIRLYANILFFIVLLSSLFIFDVGVNANVVISRFLRFSIIPMFVLLTYFYDNNVEIQLTKKTIRIATISTFYSLLYSLYNTLM